jgi:hypothetical protein
MNPFMSSPFSVSRDGSLSSAASSSFTFERQEQASGAEVQATDLATPMLLELAVPAGGFVTTATAIRVGRADRRG